MSNNDYHYLFKCIIIGDSKVGKSCLLKNYVDQSFQASYDQTIGVEFGSKIVKLQDKVLKIQIWDTVKLIILIINRQDKNHFVQSQDHIIKGVINSSCAILVVFDLTNKVSFSNISFWQNDIQNFVTNNTLILLVGNKSDLEDQRAVSYQEAKDYADQHGMRYMETSSKTGQNVNFIFEEVTKETLKKILNNQIQNDSSFTIKIGPLKVNEQKVQAEEESKEQKEIKSEQKKQCSDECEEQKRSMQLQINELKEENQKLNKQLEELLKKGQN